ncbi:helix-turn-helix transcriptional regulator [Hungatella sp. L12]|uniref:Helix-turn-helix transcriptional regulator n=1 Tax=Hungatella hominis TaxID=2763050 RepID=A0ABR7H947_9FIRM|nr:helix-turn-helix domain-containing protein [Hungatella hominis]MBC5709704.1 helix-turn-helix transcriptional regulator [Hungatella hominis]
MKKMSWRKRLFYSYIFIGVIPLLVLGAFFYYGNRMTERKELEKSNSAMLSQVLQKLDYVTEKMNSAAYHFSGSEIEDQLNDVRYERTEIDEGLVASQLMTYSEIVGDTENDVKPILYLRGDKSVYTMDGKIPYSEFEKDMNQYGDLNEASFFGTINSVKDDRSLKIGEEKQAGEESSIVYFLYPIPYMNNIPIATIGFGFGSDSLNELIKTYYTADSAIYIFNERYLTLFQCGQENCSGLSRESLDNLAIKYRRTGGKLVEERVDGGSFIIMREISANSGLSVVSITDSKKFYQSGSEFASWYIFLIAVLFIGGILLSLVLSRSNYKPIQKLVQKIVDQDTMADQEQEGINEFEIITNKWTDVQNKNEELSALLNRQRPMVVASCLRRILKGKFKTSEEMEATLKSANINLSYRYNFVILLPIPVEDSFEEDKNLRIMTVLAGFMQPFIHVYGLDMLKDNGIAVIVNCGERTAGEKNVDIRLSVADHLCRELETRYEISIPFYIGRIYEDVMDINRSFLESAAIASDYHMLGNQKIILFEEIGYEEQNIQYPILEQALFIQCLKQANEEAALKALDNMIGEIEPLKSFVITQCLCFDIINITIKTLDQLKGFELKNVDLKKLITFKSLPEFREKMAGLTIEMCRQFAEFKDSRNNERKSEILDYVNCHYGDSSMGLESVADEFGVSSNYLSRFFKQETGCSFIQYVTMIRMDRARELLVNSNKQIKEIVAEIGYIDVANFVRKFKGYEGVTPGQYREKMRI